jgi:hypothetical protein
MTPSPSVTFAVGTVAADQLVPKLLIARLAFSAMKLQQCHLRFDEVTLSSRQTKF